MIIWLKIAFQYAPLKCSKTLKIYGFLTPFKKQLPGNQFTVISQNHCNSAVTTSCIPHGEINQVEKAPTHTKKTVWAQDIKGIIYYIDDEENVYHPQDVLNNTENPKIIAKYILEDGEYSIPSLSKK